MRTIILLLIGLSNACAQTDCNDLLPLLGQRDISETVQQFVHACGPFDESTTVGGISKTLTSDEKGIRITMVNRETQKHLSPKYEVLGIELTPFTDKGGFKGEFPFGFQLGMDHKMVKAHIKQLKDVHFNNSDLSKRSSSFTYTGALRPQLHDKQVKVHIVQYDGKTITSMRLRLE